jgi:hypothetical protein
MGLESPRAAFPVRLEVVGHLVAERPTVRQCGERIGLKEGLAHRRHRLDLPFQRPPLHGAVGGAGGDSISRLLDLATHGPHQAPHAEPNLVLGQGDVLRSLSAGLSLTLWCGKAATGGSDGQ